MAVAQRLMGPSGMIGRSQRTYLDHNATAPVLPAVRDAVMDALGRVGNPSSVHAEGRAAKALLDKARDSVAMLAGVSPDGVVFTSGATEAAATALSPHWLRGGREVRVERLAVLDTDHPCIRGGERFDAQGVTRLGVDADGQMLQSALEAWLQDLAGQPGLLALCWANSETGVVQDMAAIRSSLAGHDVLLVADAVQMAGRLPIELESCGIDAAVLSAHKFGGPKGIGALILRDEDTRPFAMMVGGGQERGRRGGTESLPLIAGFGAAAQIAAEQASGADGAGWASTQRLRDSLETALLAMAPDLRILGAGALRLPNTTAFTHPAMRAETLQIAFDLQGIALSAGSACSSGKIGASHVLAAMVAGGYVADPALGALRISLGPDTEAGEIETFCRVAKGLIGRLAAASPRSDAA
ncbi:cysteine desulfurase family protein [Aureimonas frigidaquae]|uniref:Cysteine desulfurase n=1 Tax=Aureimonas frigidaquae TaxID=424757 RepID=A0A0N7KY01_9HYPH|nr:cysteine desulfurase family protein [Aureimonas frigidaquae]BAT28345.1 putative cysteine desulfurase [Aureimonas frigidaquae]